MNLDDVIFAILIDLLINKFLLWMKTFFFPIELFTGEEKIYSHILWLMNTCIIIHAGVQSKSWWFVFNENLMNQCIQSRFRIVMNEIMVEVTVLLNDIFLFCQREKNVTCLWQARFSHICLIIIILKKWIEHKSDLTNGIYFRLIHIKFNLRERMKNNICMFFL